MISTEEFLARAEAVSDQRAKNRERNEELYTELQALAVLTGMVVRRSGDVVEVFGRNCEQIMVGPVEEVVEALAAPPPSDVPFGLFMPAGAFSFATAQQTAEEEEGPVHIDRRNFTLLSELAESLSDFLDSLA